MVPPGLATTWQRQASPPSLAVKGLAGGTFPIKEKIGGGSREKGVAVLLFPMLSCPEELRGAEWPADRRALLQGEGRRQNPPGAHLRAEGNLEGERPEG